MAKHYEILFKSRTKPWRDHSLLRIWAPPAWLVVIVGASQTFFCLPIGAKDHATIWRYGLGGGACAAAGLVIAGLTVTGLAEWFNSGICAPPVR